ncbi:DUF1707 SHOCT-like domain-containing protein [Nocardia stercoris]|uniref:DUF1707 domain-containing protein n=1 Tax=Nocardia stercoris TaxID=2483361 RepID=A0A3M2KWU0_9NOCA|nr:DUF1707 domain-containing protein [Nocardia stercoris]RMI29504.1 DUF1707 domain-containing protein [Nocardia stercoris]
MEQFGNRIGTDQRERALTELSRHFGLGRLDPTEFSERSARVAAATTRDELAALFVDLPAVGAAPEPPAPRRALPRLAVALAGVTGCAIVLAAYSGQWLWLLLPAAAAVFAARRFRPR